MSQAYLKHYAKARMEPMPRKGKSNKEANGYYKSGGNLTDAYSWSCRINVEAITSPAHRY